ncbi:GNAT family N-acetyltransferase [uncultured Sunxiuqinia sp.]|uniref:GNAT family N-acetyltransferase n=1 Tax=uncultured Sunxiuqinia sp. TaxID=1573825 RepID=UPI0030DC3B62|tara:strand:- start:6351 stop:7418 length:1068 start_codon:yes stop_codon:yes gene_type:complete
MELKKIRLQDMEAFSRSELFQSSETKPINVARMQSYLNNPHALPGDVVLYLLHDENKLVAFRTLFAGRLMNQSKRFAWLSGNWVHPDYRRQGYSQQLLKEALKDWDERLMFTNYAPASLQLYLKTRQFQTVYLDHGTRFYFYFRSRNVLAGRHPKLAFLLPVLDFFIQLAAGFTHLLFRPMRIRHFSMKESNLPDETCLAMAEAKKDSYLFARGRQELEWIFKYPWLSESDDHFASQYPFSSSVGQFKYRSIKIFHESKLVGFMVVLLRDGHMRTVHLQLPHDRMRIAARFLIRVAAKNRVETLTVLNPKLAEEVRKRPNPFLFRKKMEHGIYSSFPVSSAMRKIQDGEGDFIFS